ncbi:hypothetical protein [Streptomyces incarnatus]|uniref:hypothetical protein n=1 Tax=Streptomyces incarnatus TaxID=665007 RepID=UPI000A42D263|nr:hypothetical protein [Streptomyces incarnatus]
MNQQQYPQPQQPGWGGPQQPGYGTPPQQPQPPKKSKAGRIVGFGCLGVVALFVLGGIISAAGGSGDDSGKSGSAAGSKPSATASKAGKPAADKAGDKPKTSAKKEDSGKKVVVFKVWGKAPSGALGPLDISYGSDTDNRQGHWKNGGFTATLPLNNDAMYYQVNAQLQGSGDIHCSVTVDGKTKQGHAAGGYNICDAQLSAGLFGGWEG